MVLKLERHGLEKKFFELCLKVVHEQNLELYDLEFFPKNGELRVFIFNPETRTALIEDCIKVDHALTPFIDQLDWMPETLTLEVSSPGLYRHLSSVDHFVTACGEDVTLTLTQKIDDSQYNNFPKAFKNSTKFKAALIKADQDNIEIDLKGCLITVPYSQIKKANVEAKLDFNKD